MLKQDGNLEMVKSILQFQGDETEVQAHRGTTGEFTGLTVCITS